MCLCSSWFVQLRYLFTRLVYFCPLIIVNTYKLLRHWMSAAPSRVRFIGGSPLLVSGGRGESVTTSDYSHLERLQNANIWNLGNYCFWVSITYCNRVTTIIIHNCWYYCTCLIYCYLLCNYISDVLYAQPRSLLCRQCWLLVAKPYD